MRVSGVQKHYSLHPNDGRVVSNFIIQALNGQDITVYGDGSQTRSFCYIDDLVDGIFRMMNANTGFTGPVNLGNPVETSVLDLAKLIIELTDSRSKIIFKNLPQDDPEKRKPDISLAINKLDWQPSVELEEGLLKTIDYFKKFN
jgi:UDP-glucuronate decarboxylase